MQKEINMLYFIDAKPGIITRNQPDTDNITFWDGNDQPPHLKGRTGWHKVTKEAVVIPQKKDYYYCGSWHYILPNKKWCGKKLDKGVEIYTLRFWVSRNNRLSKSERWCKECWEASKEWLFELKSMQEKYQQEQLEKEARLTQYLKPAPTTAKKSIETKYTLSDEDADRRRKLTVYFANYKQRATNFLDELNSNFTPNLLDRAFICQNKLVELIAEAETLGGAPTSWMIFEEEYTSELTQYTDTGDNGEA